MVSLLSLMVLALAAAGGRADASWNALASKNSLQGYSEVFKETPPDPPAYMVDNTDNLNGRAPIHGKYSGPVWEYSGSFENYMRKLRSGNVTGELVETGKPPLQNVSSNSSGYSKLGRGEDYWLPHLATYGKQPVAPKAGYIFYRDVTDYSADNTGVIDAVEAINAAIEDGGRCGMECGSSFSNGAIIYFPKGTYKICTPIVQLYYTQFIGDPNDPPTIKGCDKFSGIALIDTNPYIPNKAAPDGSGVNWYMSQDQFFRQIRNFVFDLTEMPLKTDENGQQLAPTGLHWQVSQACSLQNLHFKMPNASDSFKPTHVGIFMESGSGGFVSDLTFEGGAIGWLAGSQQYTARSLRFRNCITSIRMIWDWGFNWQVIEIDGGSVGLNITSRGGQLAQGIGSISIIDSTIKNIPIGILTRESSNGAPNIVLDNVEFIRVSAPVQTDGGSTLLTVTPTLNPHRFGHYVYFLLMTINIGSQVVGLWATGRRYVKGKGSSQSGMVADRLQRPKELLGPNGKLFTKSRPQYEKESKDSFLVATKNGCLNDGTGDQTEAINSFLEKALNENKIAYFPAGIYSVSSTVEIPTNSRIVGASWSQIQATGAYFGDMKKPQVVVRVGKPGEIGTLEMTDMIVSTKGPTAGAIMIEWNVKASSNGVAGMWDSHIRVGGALGSDLDFPNCPKMGYSEACITASLLLHVTRGSSGYFENVWAWVADHDNDMSLYHESDKLASQISLYSGRGILVESQGPCWFYGTSSEHTVLYQYELYYAKNIYLGHMQTESPYFQPKPAAPKPFGDSIKTGHFRGDPTFADCVTDSCRAAWGLRILYSENIIIHGAGLYSWFENYQQQPCLKGEQCQDHILEVRGSKSVAIYNAFTKGVVQIASSGNNSSRIFQKDNQQGFTTEISLWYPVDERDNVVYVGPEIFSHPTAQCMAPCTLVLPPRELGSTTTISMGNYTTSIEVGSSKDGTFVVTTTTLTISLEPITTTALSQSNIEIFDETDPAFTMRPSVPLPESTIGVINGDGNSTVRTITFPPWPDISRGPPNQRANTTGCGVGPTSTFTDPPYTRPPFHVKCPPTEHYVAEFDATITLPDCHGPSGLEWGCTPTTTAYMAASTDITFSLGCTAFTGTGEALPTYTDWPPGEIDFDEDENSDEDGHTTCNLWFFYVCVIWGRVRIRGMRWKFPKGILPPGPPPTIKFPPGITIRGKLPGPWPRVTIGENGKVTYHTDEPTECKTESAEICSTTESIIITTTTSQKPLTTTSTVSSCQTVHGCNVQNDDSTTTKQCTGSLGTTLGRRAIPTATLSTGASSLLPQSKNYLDTRAECPSVAVDDYIIYPKDPDDVRYLVDYLKHTPSLLDASVDLWNKTTQVQGGAFTAFFYINELTNYEAEKMLSLRFLGVAGFYAIVDNNNANGFEGPGPDDEEFLPDRGPWELSQMSVAPGKNWPDTWDNKVNPKQFTYDADKAFGYGQTIYLVEDDINKDAAEFAGARVRYIDTQKFPQRHTGSRLQNHGTQVGSIIVGKTLGLARNATLVVVRNFNGSPSDKYMHIHDRYLASLVAILDEIVFLSPAELAKVVINMSFGWEERQVKDYIPRHHFDILYKLLQVFDKFNVTMVAATHNKNSEGPIYSQKLNGWPSRFANPDAPKNESLQNLIVVSGTDINSMVSPLNPYMSWIAMAPGFRVHVSGNGNQGMFLGDGASLAAPHITALIAYWRSLALDGSFASELEKPANVKKLVMYMHRSLKYRELRIPKYPKGNPNYMRVPFIWTGAVEGGNCLVKPGLDGCPPELAKRSKIADLKPHGADCAGTARVTRRSLEQKRQHGGSCPLVVRPGDPVDEGDGDTLTYKSGEASQTCNSGCGRLCTGYYCAPRLTGTPPDFWDPEDPAHPPQTSDMSNTEPATPTSTSSTRTSEPTADPSPYYDCKGATLCSTINVKFCDLAVNNMERGNRIYTANSATIAGRGNCWANNFGYGCSVQIRGKDRNGKDCEITGDKMWQSYQDIRSAGDCHKCGSKHFGNGCLVSIDYDSSCNNRVGGVNFINDTTADGGAGGGEDYISEVNEGGY